MLRAVSSSLTAWRFKTRAIFCLEKSVTICQPTPRHMPEERRLPSLATTRRKLGIYHLSVAFQMKKLFYVNTIQLCWSDREIATIYLENAQLMEEMYWD